MNQFLEAFVLGNGAILTNLNMSITTFAQAVVLLLSMPTEGSSC